MLSDSNSDFLRLVHSDEFLPPISRWTTLGGLFLVGTFGVAVTLAAVIKYPVTVKAPATVRPIGELRIVQSLTEGTVQRIDVRENQQVKKGDAIARIDDAQLQTKKSQLQGNIQQYQSQLAQFNAQLGALESQIAAEYRLMNRNIASAQAELSRQQRDYRDRQLISQADLQEAETELASATRQRDRFRQAAAAGVISRAQLEEREQAVKTAQAKLGRAKAAQNPSASAIAIATEQIAQEKEKGEASLATLRRERQALLQRRVELFNQLRRDQKELQLTEREIQKSVVRATTDGTILQLNLRNPGQVVPAGEAIAQIAPADAPLVIKAPVAPQDIGQVKVGHKVHLRVSACPYPDYGTLPGEVTAISPDAIPVQANRADATATAPRVAESSVAPYEVTIQPVRFALESGDRQCSLQPGMEGRADIVSSEETVLQFILRKARLLTDL